MQPQQVAGGPKQANRRAAISPTQLLWCGDERWKWGKPSGFGCVWREEDVKANISSDPYLMNGFDKKVVHFRHSAGKPVSFRIEVDLLGDGKWSEYKVIDVPSTGYSFHTFPDGFSAQWVRIVTMQDTKNLTVEFFYN